MAGTAMSGNDTISINNTILTELGTGDCVDVTFATDIAALKVGKNGNTVFALNESGKAADVKIRVIRGGAADKFLNGLLAQQQANFAGFALMIGSFVKKIGDGAGNITSDTYPLSGGIFTKQIEGKNNVEGNTDASEAVYSLKFSNAARAIVS